MTPTETPDAVSANRHIAENSSGQGSVASVPALKTARRQPEVPNYITHHRGWKDQSGTLKWGDYVLATKYGDGDPGDHYALGFYAYPLPDDPSKRHMVVDEQGKPYRANGFRRVARISAKRGTWIVNHFALIAQCGDIYSVWHWFRAPWRELNTIDTYLPPAGALGRMKSDAKF